MSSFWKHGNVKQRLFFFASEVADFQDNGEKAYHYEIQHLLYRLLMISLRDFLSNYACWGTWSQTSVNDFILLSSKAFNYGYFKKCITLISHLLNRLLPRALSSNSLDSVAGLGSHYTARVRVQMFGNRIQWSFANMKKIDMSIRKRMQCSAKIRPHFSNTEGGQKEINCIGLLLRLIIEVYKAVPCFFFFVPYIITLMLFG